MIKDKFLNGFFKSTKSKNSILIKEIFENGLIENYDYEILDGRIISINGKVFSDDLYSSYKVFIEFDMLKLEVVELGCTCLDFEKTSVKKVNYPCKHIGALFIAAIESFENDSTINRIVSDYNDIKNIIKITKRNTLLDILLDNKPNDVVVLDTYINRNVWSKELELEFKIGIPNGKKYLIKDIHQFILNFKDGIPMHYSKDFIFSKYNYKFDKVANEIIEFIQTLSHLDVNYGGFKKSQEGLIKKRYLKVPKGFIKNLFLIIKGSNIFLNSGFYSREIKTEILESEIPVPIELTENDDSIVLNFERGLPEQLDNTGTVFLYDTIIYITTESQSEKLNLFYENIDDNEIIFEKDEKERIFLELIPLLKKTSDYLIIDDRILEQIIIAEPKFNFYFERDNEEIYLTVKVKYKEYEFNIFRNYNGKYIYRDLLKEEKIKEFVKNYKFHSLETNKFAFIGNSDEIFNFFKFNIDDFRDKGEIFYSEDFKGILNLNNSKFDINVSRGREDYFEFEYEVSNIPKNEFYNILQSFKENKKYYKLDSGEYLDLENIKLKELLNLLNVLESDKKEEDISFTKEKSIYIYEKLKNISHDYKGKDILKNQSETILEFESKDISPLIKADLRKYQKEGVNWLENLYDLKLGGILADEMGLGKTLQTISFIANKLNKKRKFLIVAPTSLIYNWKSEFNKFLPKAKVKINNESKNKRKIVLENLDKYDVIITTYTMLKNDIEIYNAYKFDCMFIDEAQYIKNSNAIIAKTCKKINSKCKFALTGTPFENNLIELWSIFDYILPGYLWDKISFNTKFNRNLFEEKILITELKKLIYPFILRRKKEDVLKELPDKIEKIIPVEMSKAQKKVYGTYIKYINDILNKEELDPEFKTESIEILSYITKLRQIAIHPSLVSDTYLGDSGKIQALKELVLDYVANGHKILIFSQFTRALKILNGILSENDITSYYIDGAVNSKKRIHLVNKFNKDATNVFLISLKAGGTGLNLTSADVVIHLDPWWNPAIENQATDRSHRIGQENIVEVIKLISIGSVEEKVINLQKRKKELYDALLNDDEISENTFKLNKKEIIEVLKSTL